MSGFLFGLRDLPRATRSQATHALSYTERAWSEEIDTPGFSGVSVRSDPQALWSSARDPQTGVQVWIGGRVAPEADAWDTASALPYPGGLAARLGLEEYLASPQSFPQQQNGAFALVVWDPRDHSLCVATDRMGFFPVYVWSPSDRPVLSTHPDVLATAVGAREFDRTTMAEALAFGRALPPYTYYASIRELAPGTVHRWPTGSSRTYWQPHYNAAPSASVDALATDLADAVEASVRRRTSSRLGPHAVMLSGGIDSRAVLYASRDPSEVTSITLYTDANAELATAQALAERAGSPHVALQRDFEHYGEGAHDAVRITGGMWNVRDAHYTALIPEIDAIGAETLLTGCYADYLFKGLTSNRTPRRLFGRALPLYEFAPYADWWYAYPGPFGEAWREPLRARRKEHFEGTDPSDSTDAGRWALELRRFRPVAREADTASRLLLQRALRWDPIFADNSLIELYQRIPPSLKLNGQVWERAVARICRDAGDVINNNTQGRIGTSEARKVMSFLYGVAYRKLRRRDLDGSALDSPSGRGSWPNFLHYIRHSTVLPRLWAPHIDATDALLSDLVGEPIRATSPVGWTERFGSQGFMRLLTLKLWLDQRYST